MRNILVLLALTFLPVSFSSKAPLQEFPGAQVPDMNLLVISDSKGILAVCNNTSKTGYQLDSCKLSEGRTLDDLMNTFSKYFGRTPSKINPDITNDKLERNI